MKNGPSPLRARSTSFRVRSLTASTSCPSTWWLSIPNASARAMMEPAAISSVLVYSE
jgi:hypothetical protein